MKNIFLSIIFLALFGIAFADNEGIKTETPSETPVAVVTLSGTVIDDISGEALAGVEVILEGTTIKTYTDFDGNYEISNIKPGKYNLIASYISYQKSLVENYKIVDFKNNVDIKLQASK